MIHDPANAEQNVPLLSREAKENFLKSPNPGPYITTAYRAEGTVLLELTVFTGPANPKNTWPGDTFYFPRPAADIPSTADKWLKNHGFIRVTPWANRSNHYECETKRLEKGKTE